MLQPLQVPPREALAALAAMPARARPRPECRDMPFVIRADGIWLYQGSPIQRKELVCLFAGVLTRDETGAYLLETPVERGRIVVEDAPFVAVELDWGVCGSRRQYLSFRLNTDQVVCAGPEHPIRLSARRRSGERVPYLHVRDGRGGWPIEARICRSVYYELVALAVPHQVDGREMLGVWSGGSFFPLDDLPHDDLPHDDVPQDNVPDHGQALGHHHGWANPA
jgi:hypothetical protein